MPYPFAYRALAVVALFAAPPAFADSSRAETGALSLAATVARAAPATWLSLGAPASAGTTYLRFTNAGSATGTAAVTLYNASTGAELGVYTSASVAPFASVQVDVASIVAGATPSITASQTGSGLTAAVRAGFRGNVQTLALTNGVLSNLTTCPGVDAVIGGVPGPDHLDFTGAVRVFNAGTQARTATLTLYKTTDGSKIGTWTSPSVPAHGSVTVSSTGLFAAISLAAGTAVPSLTLQMGRLNPGIQVDVFAQPKAGGAATSLEPRCALIGGFAVGRSRAAAEDDAADAPDPVSPE